MKQTELYIIIFDIFKHFDFNVSEYVHTYA